MTGEVAAPSEDAPTALLEHELERLLTDANKAFVALDIPEAHHLTGEAALKAYSLHDREMAEHTRLQQEVLATVIDCTSMGQVHRTLTIAAAEAEANHDYGLAAAMWRHKKVLCHRVKDDLAAEICVFQMERLFSAMNPGTE